MRWIVDDCAKFVEREIRRGRSYDAVIMDPPSYGRGPTGEVWKLEENLYPFVELVCRRAVRPAAVRHHQLLYHRPGPLVCWPTLLETLVAKTFGGHTAVRRAGPARDRERPGAALRRHGALDSADSRRGNDGRTMKWNRMHRSSKRKIVQLCLHRR